MRQPSPSTIGGGLLTEPASCVHNSTVSHWRLDSDRLEKLSETEVGADLKGLDIGFQGFVWVASGGDDTMYRLDPTGSVVGAYQGGGIDAPWAVRIDDAGNVWVANFGVMDILPPNNIYENAALSVLAGPNSPSGLPVGTPISPPDRVYAAVRWCTGAVERRNTTQRNGRRQATGLHAADAGGQRRARSRRQRVGVEQLEAELHQ